MNDLKWIDGAAQWLLSHLGRFFFCCLCRFSALVSPPDDPGVTWRRTRPVMGSSRSSRPFPLFASFFFFLFSPSSEPFHETGRVVSNFRRALSRDRTRLGHETVCQRYVCLDLVGGSLFTASTNTLARGKCGAWEFGCQPFCVLAKPLERGSWVGAVRRFVCTHAAVSEIRVN